MRNNFCQLQAIIAALEAAKFTHKDMYISYIDFKNAFGLIDIGRLLGIMWDLAYPQKVVNFMQHIFQLFHIIPNQILHPRAPCYEYGNKTSRLS